MYFIMRSHECPNFTPIVKTFHSQLCESAKGKARAQHEMGTNNVCTQSIGNPSNSYRDISV